jgi:hypothetical protein
MNRVTNTQDESFELRRRFLQDDTSGGDLLVIDRQRGYIFYTMRGGVNDRYDGCGSGYDY